MKIDEQINKIECKLLDLKERREFLKKGIVDIEIVLNQAKKSIGLNIKKARKNKKASKTLLSELSGVSRMTIHRAETGESLPGIDSILKICIALKCDFSEIVKLKNCLNCGFLITFESISESDNCENCLCNELN